MVMEENKIQERSQKFNIPEAGEGIPEPGFSLFLISKTV